MERKKRLICLDDGEDGCWKWIFMEFCNCGFLKYFFFHIYFCILKGVASSLMKYIVEGIFQFSFSS